MTTPPIDAKPAWMPNHQPADRILSTLKTRGALGIPDMAKVLDVTVDTNRAALHHPLRTSGRRSAHECGHAFGVHRAIG